MPGNVMRLRTTTTVVLLLTALVLAAGGCNMRQKMSEAFGDVFPDTPAEAARKAFNMYDPDTRRQAIASLVASPFGGEEPYVHMYRLLVDDPDPTVRAVCIKGLAMHGTVEDAPTMVNYLKDATQPPFVRWEAAKGLQQIHNPIAADALVNAVREDEDASVRMAAADALGQYDQPAVFQTLVGALDDNDFGVTLAAHRSLGTLTGADQGADAAAWLAWSENHRGKWFDNKQVYTYQPYVDPPGFTDKLKFWQERKTSRPEVPTGLEPTASTNGAEAGS